MMKSKIIIFVITLSLLTGLYYLESYHLFFRKKNEVAITLNVKSLYDVFYPIMVSSNSRDICQPFEPNGICYSNVSQTKYGFCIFLAYYCNFTFPKDTFLNYSLYLLSNSTSLRAYYMSPIIVLGYSYRTYGEVDPTLDKIVCESVKNYFNSTFENENYETESVNPYFFLILPLNHCNLTDKSSKLCNKFCNRKFNMDDCVSFYRVYILNDLCKCNKKINNDLVEKCKREKYIDEIINSYKFFKNQTKFWK